MLVPRINIERLSIKADILASSNVHETCHPKCASCIFSGII